MNQIRIWCARVFVHVNLCNHPCVLTVCIFRFRLFLLLLLNTQWFKSHFVTAAPYYSFLSSYFSPHNPSFLECWLWSTSSISLHLYKYRLVCLTLPLRTSLLPPLFPLVCLPVAALLSCFWDFFLPAKTSKTMAHWLEEGRVEMCQNLQGCFFFSLSLWACGWLPAGWPFHFAFFFLGNPSYPLR